jgi:NAD(P)-dependent dehydrogenase (short-subunit alcohol dehydrogenase family)
MAEFSGKVAIVAGGALGIGLAAARRLARDDASRIRSSRRWTTCEGRASRHGVSGPT